MDLKLFYLERNETTERDEVASMVYCAENEEEARQLANEECGDEGEIWTDGDRVSCEELLPNRKGFICKDFFGC